MSALATCPVCPHHCRLAPGAVGRCHARRNVGGRIVAEQYGRVTSLALDPIEKKPLARFQPGTFVLSLGSYGCNLACPFCQNHAISQADAEGAPWHACSPEEIVRAACDLKRDDPRVTGIAYTYNEPLVGWEFVRDCATCAHDAGLVNVLVSNGVAERSVIEELAPLIDAANIDLKGFRPSFYELCGGGPRALACVQGTIERLAAEPTCHLEVTTLIIPRANDADREIDRIARWLAHLDCGDGKRGATEITYHVTRFFPRWRMTDRPATPVATVYRLADVARRHLEHIYTGNCP